MRHNRTLHRTDVPSFYVLGAAKSGTTAVWNWLRAHPEVYLPAVKEPGYFAFVGGRAEPSAGPFDPDYIKQITTSRDEYLELYRQNNGRCSGDVSPIYLAQQDVAGRIYAERPDARLIVLLRDPVARAFSQFCHHRRDGLEPFSDFGDALAAEADRAEAG